MASLCPKCGMRICDHTAKERDQTAEEFIEDQGRELTSDEEDAFFAMDGSMKIRAARKIKMMRRKGEFIPVFKKEEVNV